MVGFLPLNGHSSPSRSVPCLLRPLSRAAVRHHDTSSLPSLRDLDINGLRMIYLGYLCVRPNPAILICLGSSRVLSRIRPTPSRLRPLSGRQRPLAWSEHPTYLPDAHCTGHGVPVRHLTWSQR